MLSDFLKLFEFFHKLRKDKQNQRIELLHAKVDTSLCDWCQHEEVKQAFFIKRDAARFSPILDFSFFNHFEKPVVLKGIELHIEHFWLGLRGLPEPIKKVTPSASYRFDLEIGKNDYSFVCPNRLRWTSNELSVFSLNCFTPMMNL